MSAYAENLRVWRAAVASHDARNPTHSSHGIGLNAYDIGRLDLEVGEELWPGYTLEEISCTAGNFRVLCDGEHDGGESGARAEVVHAVSEAYDVPEEFLVGTPEREKVTAVRCDQTEPLRVPPGEYLGRVTRVYEDAFGLVVEWEPA